MIRLNFARLLVLVCLLLVSGVLAQTTATAIRRPIVLGLGLAQYEDLPQYPVTLSNEAEPGQVAHPGVFSVAWDNDNLYVYAVFEQPEDSLTVDLAEDEPEWWLGDTLELFIKPTPNAELIHFAMNPDGLRYTDTTYLSGANYETFSRMSPGQWQLELAIPIADVLPAVEAGDQWQFKLGRAFVAEEEYMLWPEGGDFLAEDNFGVLEFAALP